MVRSGRGAGSFNICLVTALLVLASISAAFGAEFSEELKSANNLLYAGQFSESLKMAQDIAQRAESEGDSNSLAAALLQVSDGHYYLGQRESTLAPLYRALEIYEALHDFEGVGRSYYSISYYYERSDPNRMIELLNIGSGFAEKAHDDKLEMNIANATGVALWGLGQYDQAIVDLEKSIAIAERNQWDSAKAAALQNVALIHLNQGRPREALAFSEPALVIFKETGATHSYAVGLGNNGNAYRDLREFEKGLACYEEAMAIHAANGYPRGEAINLNNIADVYLSLREWDQARDCLQKAMVIHEELENHRDLLLSLSSLGHLSLEQKMSAEARASFLKALEIGERLGDPYLLDGLEISMATIEMDDGNAELARQWLKKAEEHALLAGKPASLGVIFAMRSQLLADEGNWDLANETLRKAISTHEEIQLRTQTYHWHARLAQILARQGDQDGARRHFENSLELIAQLDAMIATDRFRVGLFQEVALIYHQYATWLARQGEVLEGMAMLDQGRSRVLALRLLHSHDKGGFSEEQEAALNRISMLQRRLLEEVETTEENDEMLKLLAAAEWDYQKANGTKELTGSAGKGVDFEEFDPEVLHLSYSAQNDTLLVFSLSGGQAHFREIFNAEALLVRARMYADLMANPASSNRSRVAGKILYQILMGPELENFDGDNIIINPDLDLWTFPFVALLTEQDIYLGEQFSLGITPSWAVLNTLRHDSPMTTHQALVLANSLFSDGRSLEELASTKSEAKMVAAHFANHTMLINASETEFKALPLNDYALLHFATHTLTNVDHPLRSSIVLGLSDGEDGLLQAREIHHLALNCNLAVVSGCKSGAGKVVLGEGLQGVTNALLGAGARCVVLSRWDVTDEGADQFMTEFYQALEDHPVAAAVSLAQQKLRDSQEWAHPYYWASFYVAGDGGIDLELGGGAGSLLNTKNKVFVGFIVLLGLLGALMVRKKSV